MIPSREQQLHLIKALDRRVEVGRTLWSFAASRMGSRWCDEHGISSTPQIAARDSLAKQNAQLDAALYR